MKKEVKGFIVGALAVMLVFGNVNVFAETTKTIESVFGRIKVIVNGKEVNEETLLYNGTTYVPLRAVSDALGKDVSFDSEKNIAYINDTTNDTADESTSVSFEQEDKDSSYDPLQDFGSIYKEELQGEGMMSMSEFQQNLEKSMDAFYEYWDFEKTEKISALDVEMLLDLEFVSIYSKHYVDALVLIAEKDNGLVDGKPMAEDEYIIWLKGYKTWLALHELNNWTFFHNKDLMTLIDDYIEIYDSYIDIPNQYEIIFSKESRYEEVVEAKASIVELNANIKKSSENLVAKGKKMGIPTGVVLNKLVDK